MDESFDAIYTSPLKRCVRTAEAISASIKREVAADAALMEMSIGEWEGISTTPQRSTYRWIQVDFDFSIMSGLNIYLSKP